MLVGEQMTADGPRLSVVAPCCNEELGLTEFYRRVHRVVTDTFDDDYEIILIDDGSRDDTWGVIARLGQTDPHIVGVRLSRNYGHQLALTAGLGVARGNFVFVLDADLQDPPELLPAMFETMRREEADVVYGKRRARKGETAFKRATAHAFYRTMSRISEIDIPLDTGDFRLMTRRVSEALCNMPERDRFVRGMVAWVGFKQVPFLYDRDSRLAGVTNYPLRKMIRLAIDASVGFSLMPLRLAALGAFTLSALLIALVVYTLYSWFFLNTVAGWASTVIIILFVSIMQLLTLSVMGEYVGRIYLQSKNRPLFIVDEVRSFSGTIQQGRAIEGDEPANLPPSPRDPTGLDQEPG